MLPAVRVEGESDSEEEEDMDFKETEEQNTMIQKHDASTRTTVRNLRFVIMVPSLCLYVIVVRAAASWDQGLFIQTPPLVLSMREDTAKYLHNLDVNSAYYDPKTRSMRANPRPDKEAVPVST